MLDLTRELQQGIEAHVATGSFKQPSEVLQAALDLLEHRQGEYDQLSAVIEQVERREYAELDVADIKRRGRERRHLP